MKKNPSSHWKQNSDDHDFPNAANYLSLLMDSDLAKGIISRIKKTSISTFLAKDLLRASKLLLLPVENYHVKKDLKKIKEGEYLSPVLLVRGNCKTDRPLIVADGYHRICASYYLDENAEVPCHIVDL